MIDYNPFTLEGKTILVTGSSSGIGRSIAVECSKMGASLVITGRNAERLNETLLLLEGKDHLALTADLSDESCIKEFVEQLPKLNGIAHNAGVSRRMPTKMIKSDDIETIFKTNFNGAVLLQKYILKEKKLLNDSSVVFIDSLAPFAPTVGNALYAASKAAILGYANVLSLELAPQLIRVNSICPAMVWTDLIEKEASMMGVDYTEVQKKYPLKRFGRPEDIAYLAIYLLSDASSWMTGSALEITGGSKSF